MLRGGKSLFKRYSSLGEALQAVYPHFPWDPSRFLEGKKPPGHWTNKANLFAALDRIEQTMGIKEVLYLLSLFFVLRIFFLFSQTIGIMCHL